jgi:hypothetical protein
MFFLAQFEALWAVKVDLIQLMLVVQKLRLNATF